MNDELINRIRELQAEWLRLQPLTPENEKRLWFKLRLEWNYNSNHIEGNTLTYGETQLLLMHGQTNGHHTLREYEEMKAHDVAIKLVREFASEGRDLSQVDIRSLNQIILKEPFWKDAITPDGLPTRKQIIPGQYKVMPNNVRTPQNEIFEFAPPIDVLPRMEQLVDRLREIPAEASELVKFIAKIHHDFVLIHPFDDGNGRVARLLMNYALLRRQLPPIVIKSAEKRIYLDVLNSADQGNLEEFEEFLALNLIWSLEIGCKAARGEKIEEPTDVEKQADLLIRAQSQNKGSVRSKSRDVLIELAQNSWVPLVQMLDDKTIRFSEIFESRTLAFYEGQVRSRYDWKNAFVLATQSAPSPSSYFFGLELNGYSGEAAQPFNVALRLQIHLEEYAYSIFIDGLTILKKKYTQPLLQPEIDQIVSSCLRTILDKITEKTVS